MAKTQSPAKPRGRPKSKSEPKAEKERSKSRGRKKSTDRGRSPAPKASKPSAKRSTSRPRSRAASRSRSRKSEPKTPRARSTSRPAAAKKAATPAKRAATPEKKTEVTQTRSRRTIARDAKAKSVVDGAAVAPRKESKLASLWQKLSQTVTQYEYRAAISGLLWLLVLPFYALGLHLFCTRDKCYMRWPIAIPLNIKTYFDITFISYGLFVLVLQFALSSLPLGSIVAGFGYRRAIYKYRSNGLLCLILSGAAFTANTYYTRFPHTFILITNRFKCVSAMTVVSVLYTLFLWGKARVSKNIHTNHGSPVSYASKGVFFYDLAHGSEVSPKAGDTVDFSLLLLRAANVIWAICLYSAVVLSRSEDGSFNNHNVLFLAAAQGTHILLGSYFEINILKSAFINQGVGFIVVFSCLVITPFCATIPIRYVLDNKSPNESLAVYVALYIVYCIGLYLIYSSNNAKYQNARAGGKKVLRTGTYALVRHPNYLGELICLIVATCVCKDAVLPWVHCVYLLALLWCRIRLMEKNTNYEYKQYAEQVSSRLVPYIY